MADRAGLRPARNRIDGRGVGPAINHRLKPHLVCSTFDTCRADAIEGSQRLRANFRHGHLPQSRLRIAVLSATLARQLGKHDAG